MTQITAPDGTVVHPRPQPTLAVQQHNVIVDHVDVRVGSNYAWLSIDRVAMWPATPDGDVAAGLGELAEIGRAITGQAEAALALLPNAQRRPTPEAVAR